MDPATTTTTLSSLLTSIGSVFTQVMSWAGTVGTTITGTPLLLLSCVGIPLSGIGVGMFKRLISTRI